MSPFTDHYHQSHFKEWISYVPLVLKLHSPWIFLRLFFCKNIDFNLLSPTPFTSNLYSQLGYTIWVPQALQLMVVAVFGVWCGIERSHPVCYSSYLIPMPVDSCSVILASCKRFVFVSFALTYAKSQYKFR